MKVMLPFPLAALACLLASCDSKSPQNSTTIVTGDNTEDYAEFSNLEGEYKTGKLYIQYHVGETKTSSSEWTIHAPFEVKVTPKNIQIDFSGAYKVNGMNTDSGNKRLFIKKSCIHTILYSESPTS